jgi:hypothetical protein
MTRFWNAHAYQKEFEDTNGAFRSRKSKILTGHSEAVNLRY